MSAHENSQLIGLVSPDGLWHAEVSLVGASLLRLERKSTAIVVAPNPVQFNAFAGNTLAPWPNRLAGGNWSLGERNFQAAINEPSRDTALHGLVHDRAFQILNQNAHSLTLSFGLGSDDCYPFHIEVLVSYTLTDDGLRVEFGAVNHEPAGTSSVPFAIAAHPYFDVDPESSLTLPAEKVATVDENLIPTGLVELLSIGLHHGQPSRVAEMSLDHCFTHLVPAPGGRVVTRLTRPSLGGDVLLRQNPRLPYLMVFTQLGELTGVATAPIALEPQSAPANAFQTGDNLVWLEPGESWSTDWGVEFEEDK